MAANFCHRQTLAWMFKAHMNSLWRLATLTRTEGSRRWLRRHNYKGLCSNERLSKTRIS
jgi:hypothetical protein